MPSMAQRVSVTERVRVEEMRAAGVGVGEVARRLGRHRSVVYRELGRGDRLARPVHWTQHRPAQKITYLKLQNVL